MQLVIKLSDLLIQGSQSGISLNAQLNIENKTVFVQATKSFNAQSEGFENTNKNKTYSYESSPEEVIPLIEADFGVQAIIIP